jgi:Lar family restriction alleviation protein
MADLLPCPFCGSDRISSDQHPIEEGWCVFCGACGATVGEDTRDAAERSWNRRTPPENGQPMSKRDPRKDPIVGDILDIESGDRLRVYRADFMIGIEDAEDPGLQWTITRATWREMARTAHVIHAANEKAPG